MKNTAAREARNRAELLDAAALRLRDTRARLPDIVPVPIDATIEAPHDIPPLKLHHFGDVLMTVERSGRATLFLCLEVVRAVGPVLAIRVCDPSEPPQDFPVSRRVAFFRLSDLPDVADAIAEALHRTGDLYADGMREAL